MTVTCAVCGTPIVLTEEHDVFLGRVRFVARCHGETERVDMDEYELDRGGVSGGFAFVRPKQLSAGGAS